MDKTPDRSRIGEVIRRWRAMTDRGVRDVAKEIGISSATLSRIERGNDFDSETLFAILKWLMGRKEAA